MEELSGFLKAVISGVFIISGIWLWVFTSNNPDKIDKSVRLAYRILAIAIIALPLILVIGL